MSKHLVSQVTRARQQVPRLDGPAWAAENGQIFRSEGACQFAPSLVRRVGNWAEKRGCQWSGKSSSGSPLTELDGEMSLPMVTKIMEWVSITALLLVVSWRPVASY